jgi:hypothetical protein
MIYYFSEKYFPAYKKQAALQEIFNFLQIKEESLPQAWGRLLQLLNTWPDHPLKKNEILDIFYTRSSSSRVPGTRSTPFLASPFTSPTA